MTDINVQAMGDTELHAMMAGFLKGKSRQGWKWLNYQGWTIWNPVYENGVVSFDKRSPLSWEMDVPHMTERFVLEALVNANCRLHERLSKSAKKAAETRKSWKDAEFKRVVVHLKAGGTLSPRNNCLLCGKGLTDPESRARGIGPECWQGVLMAIQGHIEALREAQV